MALTLYARQNVKKRLPSFCLCLNSRHEKHSREMLNTYYKKSITKVCVEYKQGKRINERKK